MNRTLPVSRRVRAITASATKLMAQEAARIGGCVSLGQGVPSFPTPPTVVDAVCRTLHEDRTSGKYTLQTGMPALRQRIARLLAEEKGVHLDPETELCCTVGGMEGLLATMLTAVDQGDEVLLPSPTYASYIEQVHLAGGVPVFAPLDRRWNLDLAAVQRAITPRTRAIVLCNPGNPAGNLFDEQAVRAVCDLAVARGLVVITDETYDYLVYGAAQPFAPLSEARYRDHVVAVGSLSKKYALTGWRIGYVAATAELMAQIMKVHDATAICAPTPSQPCPGPGQPRMRDQSADRGPAGHGGADRQLQQYRAGQVRPLRPDAAGLARSRRAAHRRMPRAVRMPPARNADHRRLPAVRVALGGGACRPLAAHPAHGALPRRRSLHGRRPRSLPAPAVPAGHAGAVTHGRLTQGSLRCCP